MGESDLHRKLKGIAAEHLTKQGYEVYIEPISPPVAEISWLRHRPDLIGVGNEGDDQSYVLIECETNPSATRVHKKIEHSITVQHKIVGKTNFKQILVLPSGKLRRLLHTMVVQDSEVWIANCSSRSILKIHPK